MTWAQNFKKHKMMLVLWGCAHGPHLVCQKSLSDSELCPSVLCVDSSPVYLFIYLLIWIYFDIFKGVFVNVLLNNSFMKNQFTYHKIHSLSPFVGLRFELRTSGLQRRPSSTWATPPVHFALVILEMGSRELFAHAGLEPPSLISASQVAGITGVNYRHPAKISPS
jgi:hypothetical protein